MHEDTLFESYILVIGAEMSNRRSHRNITLCLHGKWVRLIKPWTTFLWATKYTYWAWLVPFNLHVPQFRVIVDRMRGGFLCAHVFASVIELFISVLIIPFNSGNISFLLSRLPKLPSLIYSNGLGNLGNLDSIKVITSWKKLGVNWMLITIVWVVVISCRN